MKKIILLVIFGIPISLLGQVVNLDSVLNIYDRAYRTELNDSDYEFANTLVDGLTKDSCIYLNRILADRAFSGMVTKEVVRKIIEKNICLGKVLNNLGLFKNYDGALRPWDTRNYPVSSLLSTDSVSYNSMVDFVMNSNYLNDCALLINVDRDKLGFLIRLVQKKGDWADGDSEREEKPPCFRANWMLLKHFKH